MTTKTEDSKTIIRWSVALLASFLFVSAFAATPVGKTWSKAESIIDCGNGRRGTKCFELRTVNLTWDTPTQREDGSPLGISEISLYVLQREREGSIITIQTHVGKGVSTSVKNLPLGNYTFRIATMDSDRITGAWSPDLLVPVN